ncbi:hypothetical protein [Streptomyces sp. NPDC048603]|uniref:hypothetical protein n=1 Tax=Streptomyces sp. NPDC048603 TaxID=3365577 RepID=UPI00371B8301
MSSNASAESKAEKLRKHLGWWIGIISAMVGILAFILAQCSNTGPTLTEWKTQANAACEQEMADVRSTFLKVRDATKNLESEDSRIAAGVAITQAGDAEERLVGKWRALEQPNDSHKEIESLLLAGTGLGDALAEMGKRTEEGNATPKHLEAAKEASNRFRSQIEKVGIEECKYLAPRF